METSQRFPVVPFDVFLRRQIRSLGKQLPAFVCSGPDFRSRGNVGAHTLRGSTQRGLRCETVQGASSPCQFSIFPFPPC